MRNVRPCIANVAVHLAHNTYMLVAVEKRVLFLPVEPSPVDTALDSLVCLKAGI